MKYIENNPVKGIAYDWKKIKKEYRSLGIPKEYDYSDLLPLENDVIKWYVLLSERSVGKTTNLLLLGMCMYKLYGTVIQLIRHNSTEQKASYFRQLFETINAYKQGHYIKKLTNGKYNTVYYYQRAFYYANIVDGKIEREEKPFCVALASADCYSLCSTYEAPTGDFIILDECFNETNTPEQFVHFIHLHKTIVRERLSDKIFILGNNIDINNIWFRQLTIQNDIRKQKRGEIKVNYTPEGMPIFTAFLQNNTPEQRKIFNRLHYGFSNSELNSITGGGEWKIKQYPLIKKEFKSIQRGVFFSYHDDLYMEGEFFVYENILFFGVHPANERTAKNGKLLYVMRTPEKENERFFGTDKLVKLIYTCIDNLRIVYNDNETGNLFEKFLRETE